MIKCSTGATVNHDELSAIESALGEAIESMRIQIDGDTRPNRSTHDDEYRQEMRHRRELVLNWRKCMRAVKRVREAKRT